MKKYYPDISQDMTRVNKLPEKQYGASMHVFPIDRDTGDVYFSDNNRIFKTNDLLRDNEPIEVLRVTNEVLHVERMTNGKILIVHYSGAWIADDSLDSDSWTYTVVRDETWGVSSHPFATLRNVDVFDNIVLVSCYGTKTESTDFKAWVSRDFGETFEEVFSTRSNSVDPDDAHIHGIAYDKFRNYIWMLVGDHESAQVLYSDSWGKEWREVDFKPFIPMFTDIHILPDSVLLYTDNGPDGIVKLPFMHNRPQPIPDVENATITPIRHATDDTLMFGFFLKGAYDISEYPHKIISAFPGHSGFSNLWEVFYTYNGTDVYKILGNNLSDTELSESEAFKNGDFKVSRIVDITPKGYTVNGEKADNIAIAQGVLREEEVWKSALIEIKLPEWIAVE